LQKMDFGSIRN